MKEKEEKGSIIEKKKQTGRFFLAMRKDSFALTNAAVMIRRECIDDEFLPLVVQGEG